MENKKNWIVTIVLAWFLGSLGIHRFYTGHIAYGVIQLLTAGGCGIWALIDFINLCFGNYKDAEGQDLAEYNPTAGKIVFFVWLGLVILSCLFYFLMFSAAMVGGASSY